MTSLFIGRKNKGKKCCKSLLLWEKKYCFTVDYLVNIARLHYHTQFFIPGNILFEHFLAIILPEDHPLFFLQPVDLTRRCVFCILCLCCLTETAIVQFL
jgi:hypothetical protein